jgi:hypothetical protein
MTPETQHPNETGGHSDRHYESYTLNIRPLLMGGAALVILSIVSFVLIDELFDYFNARQPRREAPVSPLLAERQPPPEPHLQITPHDDLGKLRATENKVLNSYGWVNREAGIVRIPIKRAIELLAARGLPARNEETQK